ncbi:hypothetical protein CTI12_AA162810 [Artemisia annua]|uniref:Uncharacterized protein n=1 Tax=Artemisia annua TaxID=35608 RepID=A0A2U1PE76_ARTAN|nr:hypothetical protein CTI12_AA162810 [Artemisia annua]
MLFVFCLVSISLIGDEKKLQEVLEATNEQHAKILQIGIWVSMQSLPVEAVITTLTGAFRGAVMGVVVDVLFEGACFAGSIQSPSEGDNIRPEVLSFIGGYKPLVQARNFAVMTSVNASIYCVMKRLSGKEDMQTRLVSGLVV